MKKFITTSALAILAVASSVSAQSASSTTGTGLPNTGFGGDAVINMAILVACAIVAIRAGAYALRKDIAA